MGLPSYMPSVDERNFVMRRIPVFEFPISHTITHTHGRSSLNEWSASRIHNTQWTQEKQHPCV